MLTDLRLAARRLRRAPGYALAAAGILALGIGANAAVFGVVDAALLRPFPYREPGQLVAAHETGPGFVGSVSWPNFRDWQAGARAFADLAAYQNAHVTFAPAGAGGAVPERVSAVGATPNLFRLLGAPRPLLGRGFAQGDGAPGGAQVAVVSERFWRRALGGDPAAVGRTVRLDGDPVTVVGVMPAEFRFPARWQGADVWIPVDPSPAKASRRGSHSLQVVGRLRPGASVEEANRDLQAVAARLARTYPAEQAGRGASVQSLRAEWTGDTRPALVALAGAVALVLGIACANVANLALARGAVRRREFTVRAALGATRARLAREVAAEGAVLTAAAAAAGAAFAWAALGALGRAAERVVPLGAGLRFDWRLFAFLLAAAALTTVLFALAPALAAARVDLRAGLAAGDPRSGEGRGQRRTRSALVVAQVALSLALLVGAGLLLRAVAALRGAPLGLDPAGVVTAHVPMPNGRSGGAGPAAGFLRPVLARLRATPGVAAAGAISMLPVQEAWTNGGFAVEGAPPVPSGQEPLAERRVVSPGYFAAMGVPLVAGRGFGEQDGAPAAVPPPDGAPLSAAFARGCVVMVNATLAGRHIAPGRPLADAVGRRLLLDGNACTVVGVAGDVRQAGLDTPPQAEVYYPYAMLDGPAGAEKMVVVVRSPRPVDAVAGAIRTAVREADPALPVYRVATMAEVVAESLADRRLYAGLLGGFGAAALALAAAGVYAVLAYAVAQRRREVGVRMALGARAGDVVRLVVGQGARLVAAGVVAGLAGALVLGRALGGLLYGVGASDPPTVAAAAAVLAFVALAASWVPARRAARADPAVVLRAE